MILGVVGTTIKCFHCLRHDSVQSAQKSIPNIEPEHESSLQLSAHNCDIHVEALQDPIVYIETLQEQTAAKVEYVLVEYQQLFLVLI